MNDQRQRELEDLAARLASPSPDRDALTAVAGLTPEEYSTVQERFRQLAGPTSAAEPEPTPEPEPEGDE
jgi:hypothetical protein